MNIHGTASLPFKLLGLAAQFGIWEHVEDIQCLRGHTLSLPNTLTSKCLDPVVFCHMPERTLEHSALHNCRFAGQSQGRKSTANLKFHFLKMFGAEDQHPESGELRLERYAGTEEHLPGPAVSTFASSTLTFLKLSLFL